MRALTICQLFQSEDFTFCKNGQPPPPSSPQVLECWSLLSSSDLTFCVMTTYFPLPENRTLPKQEPTPSGPIENDLLILSFGWQLLKLYIAQLLVLLIKSFCPVRRRSASQHILCLLIYTMCAHSHILQPQSPAEDKSAKSLKILPPLSVPFSVLIKWFPVFCHFLLGLNYFFFWGQDPGTVIDTGAEKDAGNSWEMWGTKTLLLKSSWFQKILRLDRGSVCWDGLNSTEFFTRFLLSLFWHDFCVRVHPGIFLAFINEKQSK